VVQALTYTRYTKKGFNITGKVPRVKWRRNERFAKEVRRASSTTFFNADGRLPNTKRLLFCITLVTNVPVLNYA
jgi:hypothetical protein